MNNIAHQRVEDQYQGRQGEEYSQNVLQASDAIQNAIALVRVRKFQKYISESDSVLEIGVGLGTNLRFLQCGRKIGFDIGTYGKKKCEEFGIEFVSDLSHIENQSFSFVICHHVIEHVPNPLGTLETIAKFLKDDGRLLIFVPNDIRKRQRQYKVNDPNHHLYSWSSLTLGNLVTSAGLEIETLNVSPFGYERALAPLAKLSMRIYRFALFITRTLRPVSEIFVVAKLQKQD